MTALDLRIKYKFERGYAPTYGRDMYGCNYKGGVTHYYAEWLEDSMGSNISRRKYQEDTGLTPICYRDERRLCYSQKYKDWLEEKYLENAQSN